MNEVRLLQVGAGAWGRSWARIIQSTPGVTLAGVVDPVASACEATARDAGVSADRCFANVEDGIAGTQCDALVIVSPPATHVPLALQGFNAGLHCLIEKPLAEDLAAAQSITDAAAAAGVHAMVSQNYRFKRAPRTVQRLIREGVVGEVEAVRIDYRKNPPFTGFRAEMDEPLIIDMSIHHLDQLRGIVGVEPATLRARSWNPSWSRLRGNASALIEMVGSRGEQVIYTGSWASHGGTSTWDGSWEIEGARGGITWKNNTVTVSYASVFDTVFMPGAVERDGVMKIDLDRVEFEERAGTLTELRDAIRVGRPAETSVEDNIKSIALVLAAVESTKDGGRTIVLKP